MHNSGRGKTLLRHLLFWVLFLVLWSTHDLNYHRDFLENLQINVFVFIPYALLVYFNLYGLTPNFLLKKKIVSYLGLLTMSIILTTWFSSKYLYFYFTEVNFYLPTANFFTTFEGKIAIVTEIILSLGLSMTLFLTDEWYQKERRLREVEQKRLEMELNLLKNQINPHFLFNSLNSIYVTLSDSLKGGKDMLLQFSDLLSYQLYETGKKQVSLKKEFDNLLNYINIERVRHKDLVTVTYEFPKNYWDMTIAPMLLLPIIENAFKHGQSSKGYKISIKSKVTQNGAFTFYVENSINETTKKSTLLKKGIGLENVGRRLQLIYPNKHRFSFGKHNSKFVVQLEIQLNENKMPNR
nr:histidine kinase [Allomuricauda sp.]